ncbi:MAG: cation:proton antiporter [Burkholderiales bacterium]
MLADHPIFVVLIAAVLAPLVGQTSLGKRVPVVVFEVVLGVVIGPHALALVEYDRFLGIMHNVGMVAVLFMAGMEMDFAQIRGRPLRLALLGWLGTIAIGLLGIGVIDLVGGDVAPWMVVIALATTGLGTLLPILRDGGQLGTPYGRMLLAAGTVGEVGPIVAASLVLSTRFSSWQEFALLLVFLALVGTAIAVGEGLRPPRVIALLARTMHQSTQLPVRISLLLLGVLVFVCERMGFEAAFGAFAAGMIVGVAARGPDGQEFRIKMDAVCFGWFAPFFFVGTGVAFDVAALMRSGTTMLLLPVFFLLFLAARGLPVFLYRRDLPPRDLVPFGLCSAVASLGIVVVVTTAGQKSGHMRPETANALIGAALLSLLVYPTAARALLASAAGSADVPDQRPSAAAPGDSGTG